MASALVVAVVTTIGTGLGQDLLHSTIGPSSSSTLSMSMSRGGAPIKIDAVILGRDAAQGGTYVFPERRILTAPQLGELNQLNPSQPKYYAWFTSRGGIDPDWSSIKLVIQGNRNHPVQLVGMTAVKRCQRPLNGTLFYSPPAAASDTIGIGFNLDAVTSMAQNYQAYQVFGDYFAAHTISLAPGEVQTLQVMAHATKHYCQFVLDLTVIDGSKQVTEKITNGGKAFSVSSTDMPFFYFKALYVGGVAPGALNQRFVSKIPTTYKD